MTTSEMKQILESVDYPSLNTLEKFNMEKLVLAQEIENNKLMTESTLSGDIAQYVSILMPVVRRAYPMMVGTEIAAVQPLATPSGYLYGMVSLYQGRGDLPADKDSTKVAMMTLELAAAQTTNPFANANVGTTGMDISFENTPFAGKVIYSEMSAERGKNVVRVLVNITTDAAIAKGTNFDDTATYAASLGTFVERFNNEAMWLRVLKNYTGGVATAAGEVLGKDMKELGFTIKDKLVKAETRALKGTYSLEMLKDLQAQHGLAADKELSAMLASEVALEIDREIISKVNSSATQLGDFALGQVEGRFDIEKYRGLVIKLMNEAREVGRQTRRSGGNTIIVSPKVASVLDQVGNYVISPSGSSVDAVNSGIKPNVGVFDNRFKIVVDNFADYEYATVLYKGTSPFDAGVIYAPYSLTMQQVVDPSNGQPGFIIKSRQAIESSPLHPEAWARHFAVDFTGTVLE